METGIFSEVHFAARMLAGNRDARRRPMDYADGSGGWWWQGAWQDPSGWTSTWDSDAVSGGNSEVPQPGRRKFISDAEETLR